MSGCSAHELYIGKCKECRFNYHRKYREKNKDKLANQAKDRYISNRDNELKKRKVYWQSNKERMKEYNLLRRPKQHPDYYLWRGVKRRCKDTNNKDYIRYGGRGIGICEEWENSFTQFITDMGPRPEPRHLYSIERKDVNKGYNKENCIWLENKDQCKNRRRTKDRGSSTADMSPIYYPYGNLTTLSEFSKEVGIPLVVCKYRYAQHPANPEWILSSDYDNRYYEWNGHKYNLTELSLLSGESYSNVYNRIKNLGWSIDRLLSKVSL